MDKTTIDIGKELEEYVAFLIKEMNMDNNARPSKRSGGTTGEKADISTNLMIGNLNVGIECKHQAKINFKESWKQTCELEKIRREPILVYNYTDEPLQDSKAIIRIGTLLELIKNQKEFEEEKINREGQALTWKLKDFKNTLNKVIKYLE